MDDPVWQQHQETMCSNSLQRVVQTKGSTPFFWKSTTAHWQQVKAMIKDDKEAPDPPCTQVLIGLTKFLNEKHNEGCKILLMADASESSSKEGSKWKAFLANNGLEDLHEYVLDELPPTTMIGSSTRIDCMAAT